MEKFDVYKDIAKRTDGDILIGVVGPVRTGKSTFITKFSDILVTPNITNKTKRQIAIDELPQSGSGKTITTTEPKFVPAESVKISIKGKAQAKVRLIDCVGYMVDGALGTEENGEMRLVKTPWSDQPIPLDKASEIGTEKVIKEHSTVGVLVTTDGSFTDIARENYVQAEEKVVADLKKCGKPFVIVLNTKNVKDKGAIELKESLSAKYGVKVILTNLISIGEEGILEILENLLLEFPLKSFDVNIPKWMQVLPFENEMIAGIIEKVKDVSKIATKMKHYKVIEDALLGIDCVDGVTSATANLGEGLASYEIKVKDGLFYEMLSSLSGDVIDDEFALMSYVKELAIAKQNYIKLKDALQEVDDNGYGIVIPTEPDMELSSPEVVKRGGAFGVKLKAKTSCMHLLKIGVEADVSPISGTEQQCKDFAGFLKEQYEENPEKIWKTDIFGKQLSTLVCEEIVGKISSMKPEIKEKMRKTVTKIVNDKKSRLVCIIL
ncbi:MAG: stage IV sporulation protein A [Clostridiales bacterium]|nr:stage IV sporulation protein A [Clostridiales bacterium]